MVDLAERLDDIRVHARAPGTEIEAELRDRGAVKLTFGESIYDFISESALESALVGIARMLWTGWQRQYQLAIDETDLNIDANDRHDLNFFAERDEIESTGTSGDERISISAVGMQNFSVRVKPGTVREISEDEFSAGAAEAATRLVQDYQDKVDELKKRYFG
ncbi:hypothetical protein [Sciscionella marina]|uniref:hypothetical protein n=1 Tax=Sciscionella marina TaxID=508770 RepID=UPI000371F697|nr:hypothetical protein [Sciscionella marina]